MSGKVHEEVDVGVETVNVVLSKTRMELLKRRGTILAPNNQLGNHRIIMD